MNLITDQSCCSSQLELLLIPVWKHLDLHSIGNSYNYNLVTAYISLHPGLYKLYETGFALCGSALATVVFAASAQLLTAAMTRCVLKRRLLRGQQMAVRYYPSQ